MATAGTDAATGAPARVRGWRRGVSTLAISAAAGVTTALSLSRCGVAGLHHVAGWDAGALVFAGLCWLRIMGMDATGTRGRAAAEDPGRTTVWLMVIAASAFSLFATFVVLHNARVAGVGERVVVVGLCLLAVAMAWTVTHTAYALRYAHLYYRDDDEGIGGLEFPNEVAPCYFDFAYFSFTVGMCFQVSDVVVSSPQIRRAVLGHAILSFVYNTTIMAFALNLVFSLLN